MKYDNHHEMLADCTEMQKAFDSVLMTFTSFYMDKMRIDDRKEFLDVLEKKIMDYFNTSNDFYECLNKLKKGGLV